MLWVRDNEPHIFARSRYLLLPGSYMAYRLTGEAVVDYSNASSTLLLDVRQKAWSQRGIPDRLRVPLGISADGVPVELDIKESAQGGMGPHGLLIGATPPVSSP